MIKPCFAGSFYSSEKEKLKKDIKIFLKQGQQKRYNHKVKEQEKEKQKQKQKKKKFVAGIAPHAGYLFSGKCASKLYKNLIKSDIYIIFGTNHVTSSENFIFSNDDFETPLGFIKNNKKFSKLIFENLKKQRIKTEINNKIHEKEHSIEVQLPFLQILHNLNKKERKNKNYENFEIIPIIFPRINFIQSKKFTDILINSIKNKLKISKNKNKIQKNDKKKQESNKKICFIASSDFTHYGFSYGFMPFFENIKEKMYKLDRQCIKEILNLNSEKFLEKANQTTICGSGAISCLIEVAKKLNFKPELIDYYTSGDIMGDYSNVVGYASIGFLEK